MTTKALSLTKIDRNIDWKDNPVPQNPLRNYLQVKTCFVFTQSVFVSISAPVSGETIMSRSTWFSAKTSTFISLIIASYRLISLESIGVPLTFLFGDLYKSLPNKLSFTSSDSSSWLYS